jgi:hypothetical protein
VLGPIYQRAEQPKAGPAFEGEYFDVSLPFFQPPLLPAWITASDGSQVAVQASKLYFWSDATYAPAVL